MQATVRAALKQIRSGLEFDVYSCASSSVFGLLQLHDEDSPLLPSGTSIFLNLFDHRADNSQRLQMALEHRAVLEYLVRLMSASPTQWNAYFSELWEPELMQRFEDIRSLTADQRSLVENHDLPTFVLRMAAEDLTEKDFDLCYEFLACPSVQVLSFEQRELLDRVDFSVKPQQLVVELGLQLCDCKPTEEILIRLQHILERLKATDRSDPLEFPVHFKITTLWFGLNAFAMPCNMSVLKDLSSISGICVQDALTDNISFPRRKRTESLEDFPPRVLLDSSARSLDLSKLDQTGQHTRSICSTLRATDHIQEVSFERRFSSGVHSSICLRLITFFSALPEP